VTARVDKASYSDLKAVFFNGTLKDAGGLPAHGNLPGAWKAGTGFDFENPEYRQAPRTSTTYDYQEPPVVAPGRRRSRRR